MVIIAGMSNHARDGKPGEAGNLPGGREGPQAFPAVTLVPNLIVAINAECNRIRRALPECDHLVANGRLARQIILSLIKEGEDSIASGDVARMVKALAELQGIAPAHLSCNTGHFVQLSRSKNF